MASSSTATPATPAPGDSYVQSFARGLQVIRSFSADAPRQTLTDVAGRSGREKHIRDGASKVDIDWKGRLRKNGLVLWWVGTNHAKDLIYGRLQIERPGPGYIHFSQELPDEFFKMFWS